MTLTELREVIASDDIAALMKLPEKEHAAILAASILLCRYCEGCSHSAKQILNVIRLLDGN